MMSSMCVPVASLGWSKLVTGLQRTKSLARNPKHEIPNLNLVRVHRIVERSAVSQASVAAEEDRDPKPLTLNPEREALVLRPAPNSCELIDLGVKRLGLRGFV